MKGEKSYQQLLFVSNLELDIKVQRLFDKLKKCSDEKEIALNNILSS